jgi:ribulose-5-phosphate 4-epimerase/fuculose-1-phosphate aldolase
MRLFLGKRSQELKRHGLAFTVYKHGIFVLARNIDEAFDNLLRVEKNAQTQIFATML